MDPKRRNLLAGLLGAGSLLPGLAAWGQASQFDDTGSGPGEFPLRNRRRTVVLSRSDLDQIIRNAVDEAQRQVSEFRSLPSRARIPRVHVAVVDRQGKQLRFHSMQDAWEGGIDLAIGKARTAAFFSSDQNALTSRIIGELSQAHGAEFGTGPAGPLWGIWATNQPGLFGTAFRNGIVTIAGGVPLYHRGVLAGGIGVSGDSPDVDEAIAFAGARGFRPPADVATLGPIRF